MASHNTRSRVAGGRLQEFDAITFETTTDNSPLEFEDDFVGAQHVATIPTTATIGYPWVAKIVGAAPPTVGGVANGAGGQMALTLTSASQKQDAALYMGDQLTFDITKGLVYECRAQLTVLPSAASVQTVFGLSSAWIDGPDNGSFYLEFGATASGAINCRSQDGVTQTSAASGVTVLNTEWHIYRIDASDVTNIRFYIDGADVTPAAGVSFAATGANAVLQAYASVYKPSGTGVATTTLDVVKIFTNRV